MKKSLFGVVAGIFVGCLISFLAIVLLTGSEDKQREREELREVIARADEDAPLDADAANGNERGGGAPRAPREGEGRTVSSALRPVTVTARFVTEASADDALGRAPPRALLRARARRRRVGKAMTLAVCTTTLVLTVVMARYMR